MRFFLKLSLHQQFNIKTQTIFTNTYIYLPDIMLCFTNSFNVALNHHDNDASALLHLISFDQCAALPPSRGECAHYTRDPEVVLVAFQRVFGEAAAC